MVSPVLQYPGRDLSLVAGNRKEGNVWLEVGGGVVVTGDYCTDDGQLRSYCCQRVVPVLVSPEAVVAKDGRQDVAGTGTAEDEVPRKTAAGDEKPDDVDSGPARSDEDADWDLVSHDDLVEVEKDTQQDNLQGREAPRPTGSWMGGLRRGLFG